MRKMWVWIFLTILSIDQLTKWWFSPQVYNQAGVFGLGENLPWIGMSLAVLGLMFWWFIQSTVKREKTGLLVLVAAGFSNFLDRVFFDGVRDFIWWPIIHVYGNVADVILFLTVGYLLLLWFFQARKAV